MGDGEGSRPPRRSASKIARDRSRSKSGSPRPSLNERYERPSRSREILLGRNARALSPNMRHSIAESHHSDDGTLSDLKDAAAQERVNMLALRKAGHNSGSESEGGTA